MLLIIEPDVIYREALVDVFEWADHRHRITAVPDQHQGLKLIKQNSYSIVVFDSDLSNDMPLVLRKACPDSLLIMSTASESVADAAVDGVISKPATRLEAIVCYQRKKERSLERMKIKKDKAVQRERPFRLNTTQEKTMEFTVGLINDPGARFTIPMGNHTAISEAMLGLGREGVPFILVRHGKAAHCSSSDILQQNDVLLLER